MGAKYTLQVWNSALWDINHHCLGGSDDIVFRNEVIAWKETEQEWVVAGALKNARGWHGVTNIHIDSSILKFCQ